MKLNTKNDIYSLMNSTIPSAGLGAAIETGLLWQLAAHPKRAQEIAQELKIPGKRCYYWLQLLNTMGILEYGPNGYGPSSLAREAILDTHSQESWQHLALDERERSAGVHNLSLFISEPGSIWAAQGLSEPKDYVEKMRASPARAREFTRMLFEIHQPLANQIAALLDLSDVQRMMDLGGGSGVVSMALLRKYPALTSTVVDIENVCLAGREIAAEEGLSDRISYHPVEFASDEFPTGFDMVLQCDVGAFGLPLFQKLFETLKPGGRLIFVEHYSPTDETAPVTRLDWTFLDSLRDPHFIFPTRAQVKAQLAQAGFDVAPEHQTLGSGWIIFQANR
jgi:predicted TPR repeat methyltransferase